MSAEDFAEQIARTYDTRPRRHGREYRVFCPHHEADGGAHSPSLAIWDKGGGRCAWKCMTGCSRDAVRSALKARGISVPGNGPRTAEQQLAAAQANEQRRLQSLRNARAALLASEHVRLDSPVDKYLVSRGLHVHAKNDFLTVLEAPDPQSKVPAWALLGIICDLSTLRQKPIRSTGIVTLSLNNDGTPALKDGKKFRSIVGTQSGFGVPFGKLGDHMVVAEGLETAISALELIGADFCVATLSASNMPNLAIPEWVRKVTIAQDNDEPGIAAGNKLRLAIKEFFDVRVMTWAGPEGWDANDEIMKQKGLK